MKITKKDINEAVEQALATTQPGVGADAIEWPEPENEEDEVYEMLMQLCAEGENSFRQMYAELTENPYIIENPKKFERLSQKIKNLCDEIENIWVED